ncbi:hypothetical protein [Gloeocapsa sp. PCC 73106]|uniref:hypothetical protein n=1 Tax=Gloeocapsa sp. PCC 73106 TaxID=102232 RepID=UPI0002ACA727|nr:hypothetical protein [Gloeocapsa sp. PCC 73106]ELR98925.1 hypothetical protein GLO73106DRAFT_00027650 [Gloeocapsa sp. PCC 73106]
MKLINLRQIILFAGVIFLLITLKITATPTNLVVNGDFEAGNQDFISGYTHDPSLGANKTYAIANSPNALNQELPSFGDYTSGTGKMMIVRSSRAANETIWEQTVSVEPETDYQLSGAFARAVPRATDNERLAKVGFYINDGLKENVEAGEDPGVWQEFVETWNSDKKTSATIKIRNSSSFDTYFAIDDISLEVKNP